MVSVAPSDTLQRCVARTNVTMTAQTVTQIRANEMKKGDVLGTARFAALHSTVGAHRASPAANQSHLQMSFAVNELAIEITATAVDLELSRARATALTAAAIAALTIYDMCKAIDRQMVIDCLRVEALGA